MLNYLTCEDKNKLWPVLNNITLKNTLARVVNGYVGDKVIWLRLGFGKRPMSGRSDPVSGPFFGHRMFSVSVLHVFGSVLP